MGRDTARAAAISTQASTARPGRVTQEGEPDLGLGNKPQPPQNTKSGSTQAQKDVLLQWIVGTWVAQYLWR
jgi:hypothetical protein